MQEIAQMSYRLGEALLSIDRLKAKELLMASAASWGAARTLEEVVARTLERIGDDWQRGSVALSQVYMSSLICEELIPALLPGAVPRATRHPKMAIAVLADYHQLGKRMVHAALRSAGFELLDYGAGVEVDDLVDRAIADGVGILLLSTLMLPSALKVRDVRTKLDERGANVRIVVGGAPYLFDAGLWKEVGADAMGASSTDAIRIVTTMTGQGASQQ